MPSQHANIAKTIHQWLRNNDVNQTDSSTPCALVIAGFHTGRSTVASFFDIATGKQPATDDTAVERREKDQGQEQDQVLPPLSLAQIFEVDVDLKVRDWAPERPKETKEEAKRWCACGVLVRKEQEAK